jgi:hypothetical protein
MEFANAARADAALHISPPLLTDETKHTLVAPRITIKYIHSTHSAWRLLEILKKIIKVAKIEVAPSSIHLNVSLM